MRSFTDVVWAGMKYLISKNMSNPDIDWHVWSSPASKEEKHSSQWSYVEDINPQELTKIQQKQFHGIKCVAGCLCIPVKDKNFQITQQECRNIPGEQQVVEKPATQYLWGVFNQRYLQLWWHQHFHLGHCLKKFCVTRSGSICWKECFTVLLTCSASGRKEKLQLVGKAKWFPKCASNLKYTLHL